MPELLRVVLGLILLFPLAGCSSLLPPPEEANPPEFEFRLGPGDRIKVGVWGEQQLQLELQLGPDGIISLPLVGDVELDGLNLDEARILVAKRFKAAYVDPVVSLSLIEMRSHIIHVVGEVLRPGTVPYVQGATVLGAVQAAGGFRAATADLEGIHVVRFRTTGPVAYGLDLSAVLDGEISDLWLRPGDTVYVPPRLLTRWNRWWRQAFWWSDPVEAPQ